MIERVAAGGLLLVMVTLIAWQIGTGNVLGGDWRVWFRRSERPVMFWSVVAFQTLAAVLVALMARCVTGAC
ncbi:MAG TPA: hypothetical protein VF796_13225 [Humisphaera sp.]